jgi:hypothetical protein
VTLKVVPKTACDPENCLKADHVQYMREINQGEQRKPVTENFMRLSEQFLELVNIFNEASRNIIFS